MGVEMTWFVEKVFFSGMHSYVVRIKIALSYGPKHFLERTLIYTGSTLKLRTVKLLFCHFWTLIEQNM